MSDDPPSSPDPQRPRRAQFSLWMLMLVMLLLSVTAAVLGGLLRDADRQTFVLFGVAAPIGVMLILNVWLYLKRIFRRR